MKGALAFDTSNYTTSVAYYAPERQLQARKLLTVPSGERGLRQQEALFQHVQRLPDLTDELFAQEPGAIAAVGASTAPREVEGSYMPCFLAGSGQARTLAAALSVPFYPWSHQQGHLAAAAWSAGRLDLLDRPFLAWHLSGHHRASEGHPSGGRCHGGEAGRGRRPLRRPAHRPGRGPAGPGLSRRPRPGRPVPGGGGAGEAVPCQGE